MSPPSRRESLQALATTLAVGVTAGCIADLGGSDSDDPETLRVILDWDLGRRTRKVDVVRSATPTPSG